MDQTYAISGVNVGVLSDTQMVIEPFSMWMWDLAGNNGQIVNFSNTKNPDITVVGLNGRDFGSPGTCPDGAYNLYGLYNPTTDDVGFIVSDHNSYGAIGAPPGYTFARKLMYGVVVVGGKLYPNHCAHWPMPKVMFTTQTQVAAFFSNVIWAPIDLSKLIPENARMGHFRFVVTGPNSNVWIAPTANLQYSKLIMYNEIGIRAGIDCRVDGNEKVYIQFQTGAGGRLDVYLDGFSMTEVD
jgi:hypothetical protein